MEPAHDITQNMEGLTIKPKARAVTPYTTTTTMESTNRITQEMEDMTLNPKARVVTPFTATTSSHTQSVSSQQQPQSSPPAPFCFAANPTGGYVYTTTSGGLGFSNPNASSSSAATTTTTVTNQSQTPDLASHLLNCNDPIGFYKFSLYHSHFPSLSHSAINRITKSRSSPTLRKRYHQARQQIPTPFPSTTVHEARIERVPGTKIIYTTTAEEEAEEEKGRMTMAFFEHCIRRTNVRVVAEKAAAKAAAKAKAAREAQEQSGSGTGACENDEFPTVQERLDAWRNEVWMPRVKVSRTYVNGEGDVVEESWEKASPPMSLGEASEGSHGMNDVEESVWEEDDEMVE